MAISLIVVCLGRVYTFLSIFIDNPSHLPVFPLASHLCLRLFPLQFLHCTRRRLPILQNLKLLSPEVVGVSLATEFVRVLWWLFRRKTVRWSRSWGWELGARVTTGNTWNWDRVPAIARQRKGLVGRGSLPLRNVECVSGTGSSWLCCVFSWCCWLRFFSNGSHPFSWTRFVSDVKLIALHGYRYTLMRVRAE